MWIFGLLLTTLLPISLADRVLVLYDNAKIKETHSIFLKSLTDRGHSLEYKSADDSTIQLIKFGEKQYDNVVLFAPSVDEFGGTMTAAEVARFVDMGGNVLLAGAGANVGSAIRDIAADNGFEFTEKMIDHVNYDASLDDGTHTTVLADAKKQLIDAPLIVGDRTKLGLIVYSGGALVAGANNRLRVDLLKGASTSYAADGSKPLKEYPSAVGKSAVFVSAVQGRNNARVVISASLQLFSDAFINAKPKNGASGNGALVAALARWTFKESGVLRVKKVTHHKQGETTPPREYTITEHVDYAMEVEELKDGKWVPFTAKDVQLEFVRIDPFLRTTLKNTNGRLSAKLKLPDVYGVFKFLVDYRRVGYTHLHDVQQVSVRPLWHTQYERFIRSAYPYYVSSFSMMASVLLFSCVFLYHKGGEPITHTKKTN